MQCVVGGGLGLGEVKRCYCLEVSNPTQNKEDGRNVLCSPISVLKAAKVRAHTHTRTYKYILYICMNAHVNVHPHIYTQAHTHTTAHYLESYTPALSHTDTHSLIHKHLLVHTCHTLRQTAWKWQDNHHIQTYLQLWVNAFLWDKLINILFSFQMFSTEGPNYHTLTKTWQRCNS